MHCNGVNTMKRHIIEAIYNEWVEGDDTSVETFAETYGYTVPEAVQLLVISHSLNEVTQSETQS